MFPWGPLNRELYKAAAAFEAWRARQVPGLGSDDRGARADDILYVSWGRIGDAVLGTAALDVLRARTGRRVVVVGRSETAAILAPRADAFVPLPDLRDADAGARFATAISGPFFAVVGDLHVFHGGLPTLAPLFCANLAQHRLLYSGYAGRGLVAPIRPWPRDATVVPALSKFDKPATRHVLFDTAHYLEAVLARLGAAEPTVTLQDLAPTLPGGEDDTRADPPTLVCQPFSNNRKKDWPADAWRALLARFAHLRIVILGGASDRARAVELAVPHAENLCGATDLPTAIATIRRATAFVGGDSGLAHVAAALRRPTVVVGPSSNLGYFFPYPTELGFTHVHAVHDPRFAACSGCITACEREPIWRTQRQGALCLRTLPVGLVAEALHRVLAEALRAAQREPALAGK